MLAVTAVAGIGQPHPAAAATSTTEHFVVPANGVWTLHGHGWGHGHGMSQWGAQGAALQGVDYRTILTTYYPNTAWGSAAGTIRVKLSGDDGSDVQVAPATGLAVHDMVSGTRYVLPSGPLRWRIYADVNGVEHVQRLSSAGWSGYGPSGATLQFEGAAETRLFLANGSSRGYEGALRATPLGGRTIMTLNVVALDAYVNGVVPRESSSSWQPAALQAQAVAARSYAANLRAAHASASYDICDTTSCQVYGGVHYWPAGSNTATSLEPTSTRNAVSSTAGQVLTYGGQPIFAEFSSSNGGWTVASDEPYLTAHADPWDGADPNNTEHTWTATLSAAQVETAYPGVGTLQSLDVVQRDGNGQWGGRVLQVVLHGVDSAGNATTTTTTGYGIYYAHSWPGYSTGLRSNWWEIDPTYDAATKGVSPDVTLVQSPGVSTGKLVVDVTNTGTVSWDTTGLHLITSAGTRDPLNGRWWPGAFARNLSAQGSSTVAPGEVARFVVNVDGSGVTPGVYHPAYRVAIGSAPGFGQVSGWTVTVQAPAFSGTAQTLSEYGGATPIVAGGPDRVSADGTVLVPRNGSTTVQVPVLNTGNVAWPVGGPVRLGTSGPRNRVSPSAGASWLTALPGARPSALTGELGVTGATSVAPGHVGVFTVELYGNNLAAGTTDELFEPVWENVRWISGSVVRLHVVRIDTTLAHAAELVGESRSTSTPAYPIGARTIVVRYRNVGTQAWQVGTDRVATASPDGHADPLATADWASSSVATPLAVNLTSPGATTVAPGEVGEWRVPVSSAHVAPGTYQELFRPVAGGTPYGTAGGTTVSVVPASFTVAAVHVPSGFVVPRSGTTTVSLDVKNTGNISWPVGGGFVRLVGPSASHAASWITSSRITTVTTDLSNPRAAYVGPGQIARFTFEIAGNGRAPGTYTDTVGVVWDHWRWSALRMSLTYTVR